jgi:hypothetical protein
VVTLALAAGAAVAFGVGDAIGFMSDSAEALFVATWILGWTLLAWAMILAGFGVLRLVRGLVSQRSPSWSELLLLVAGAAVIIAVVWTHPLGGSGSGVG